MNTDYKIERTQNSIYIDEGGQPVNGYVVYIRFFKWSEVHSFNVPILDPVTIKQAADNFIETRTKLDALGG